MQELVDKGVCDKGFIWNPSNCQCECDKTCDIGEYQINQIVSVEKKLLIHWLKNALKILKKQNQLKKKLQTKMKQNQLKKLQTKINMECYFGYFSYYL